MAFIDRMLSLAREQLKRIPTLTISLLKGLSRFVWRQIKATPQRIVRSIKFFILLMCAVYMFGGLIAALIIFAPKPDVSSYQAIPNLPLLKESTVFSSEGSMVRIFNADGEFTCTGFVVGKNYVVTAGHCISEDNILSTEYVTIENLSTGEQVIAKPAGINSRMDWGLIYGDFSRMPAAKVAYNTHYLPSTVIACGYPQGTRTMHCESLSPKGNSYFAVRANGALFPGMSGGPVFSPSGVVVGINSAVTQNGSLYAPTIGLFACFGIADF